MRKFLTIISILTIIILIAASCGPVNRFTRVKKIPREYSMNYCGGEIRAPKSDINKKPWIVYSDRANNATYNNAGGRTKAQDIGYLDPFLVIGKKKDYLKLIKYTPDILKNGKLDYKKAEYYGWIHKSKLLLNYQSVTDISTGLKDKMLISFADTIVFNNSEKYLANDSIILYKDLKMDEKAGAVSVNSIVYPIKESIDNTKTLIAKTSELTPEGIQNEVLGWIDNALLQDKGQVLYVDPASIPMHMLNFKLKEGQFIPYDKNMDELHTLISGRYKTIQYAPVYSYAEKERMAAFKTALDMPVLDYDLNYIFNVNGGHISYSKFRSISKKLKDINIVFVFDGKQKTINYFPQIVNALQNLQPLFENKENEFHYRFGCVMDFDSNARSFNPQVKELDTDYSKLVDFLSDRANSKTSLRAVNVGRAWGNINKAFDLIKDDAEATNLIVIIGETGYSSENITESIQKKLLAYNCRVVGFQVYTGEDDSYNNFVLNIESMITSYSDKMLKTKGDLLVSPKQLRYGNYFTAVGEMKNGYRLDFPENSITQGAVFFPQKGETLPLDILTNNVDTIIQQIKNDNNSLVQYMTSAFVGAGNDRTRFDSLFTIYHHLQSQRMPGKAFVSGFKTELPGWSMPSAPLLIDDTIRQNIKYKLLFSETEMQNLKEFTEKLSMYEVDYIDMTKGKKKEKKKPCNCPDDDIFVEIEQQNTNAAEAQYTNVADTIRQMGEANISIENQSLNEEREANGEKGKYADTKNIRKHLYNLYIKEMQYCKLCKQNKKILKKMTLAQAQAQITHCPLYSEELASICVEDLRKKKKLTDLQLEKLIKYYKEKKTEIEKAEMFESNGQKYYWIDMELLP